MFANHAEHSSAGRAFMLAIATLISVLFSQFLYAQDVDDTVYRLSPMDELDIYVWKEEDLQKSVVVRPDGAISFPLVGELKAEGKTIIELQNEITEGLRKYIPGAVVTVSISKVHGYRVYVVGKVVNPGQYTLGNYVNVIQAITVADGVTPYADKSKIKIIRKTPAGERVFDFNYDDILKGKNLKQNILLKSGDTVLVP